MKILLTAFEPFGGDTVNPAQVAVRMVPDEVAGAQIVKIDVPVVVGKSIEAVRRAMEKEQPDAVLCIGQAGGRIGLTPERVAINIDDARIPDNEGNQPIDQPIYADGAPAYFSSLPVKAMVAAIREAGVPA
ncbi:MAG: pyroglutamyl-peptidase I, partial [Clostridiales bacterium]|nr:pyroglutamyl-peptidase I [Clostridiales bacterium]